MERPRKKRCLENQTEEICLEMIKHNGWALKYVLPENQTLKICLEAVKQDGRIIQYVLPKNQTEEICLTAVKQYGMLLKYVVDQTAKLCLEAVKQYGLALQYVKPEFQTEKMRLEAVSQFESTLQYIKPEFQTEKICLTAIKRGARSIKYIKNIDMMISTLKKIKNDCNDGYTNSLLLILLDNVPEHLLYDVKLRLGLIEKNNDTLTDTKEITCGICMENKTIIALGCGHLFCEKCSDRLTICPICRSNITQRLRIFI